jgi:IS5 family transposase
MTVGMAVERSGVPVGVLTDAANVGEPDLGERVIARVPAELTGADVPVVADEGFDRDALRDELAVVGYRLRAPHRGNRKRPSRSDGRRMRRSKRRYVVERTFAWVQSFHRVATRYEYLCHLYDGFVSLACAFIALSKL